MPCALAHSELEPISKSSEEDNEAGELDKAEEVLSVVLPAVSSLFVMQAGTATGHFYAGRYDEAAAWAAKSIGENPKYPPVWRTAAASNALLGRQEQAQNAMARLRQLDPTLRIATLKSVIPINLRPDLLAKMVDGSRKAGLPE